MKGIAEVARVLPRPKQRNEQQAASTSGTPQRQQRTMPFASLTHGKEAKHEAGRKEEAEGRQGSEEAYASPPSSPSSSYSSSSSCLTTTCGGCSCSCSSLCSSSSFPLSRPARPVVPASLEEGHSELSPRPFIAAPPASSPLPAPLRLADSPSAGVSLVPLPEPTGFRRMPRDPTTGRRICFYFNHTGCLAGARCAYTHVKMDISLITPGAFYKPIVPSTPSLPPSIPLSGLSFFPSPEVMQHPQHPQHLHSFPVGMSQTLPPPPPPSFSPSPPSPPAYVMYYVCVPPSHPPSFPPSNRPALPPFFHGGAPSPVPVVRGGGGGGGMEGGWTDSQEHHYYHQVQREQQALGAMKGGWEGGSMKIRGAEMQYHQQHAQYQQQGEQHYYYHQHQHQQQQQQQRQSKYFQGSEEECEWKNRVGSEEVKQGGHVYAKRKNA